MRGIPQILGQDRIKVAEEIILNYQGSSNAYRAAMLHFGKRVSSEEVYRKILQEYHNRENSLHEWYSSLMTTALTSKATIKGKKIDVYVQQISPYNKFTLINYSERQLDCIHLLSYEDRFLHIDATGSLVSIKKVHTKDHYLEYNRILHYFCCLKNRKALNASTKEERQ